VEPRGIEPLSEDQKNRASPSAVCVLTFPPPASHRRDTGISSFIKSGCPQSLEQLVPCYYDAATQFNGRLIVVIIQLYNSSLLKYSDVCLRILLISV
jgi:hypothetical protein